MWADAIRMEALKIGRNEGEDQKKLNRLAVKLIEKALEGDVGAMKEVGDRLDGKPHQSVAAEVSGGLNINVVRFADDNDPE